MVTRFARDPFEKGFFPHVFVEACSASGKARESAEDLQLSQICSVCFLLRHPNFACFASERVVQKHSEPEGLTDEHGLASQPGCSATCERSEPAKKAHRRCIGRSSRYECADAPNTSLTMRPYIHARAVIHCSVNSLGEMGKHDSLKSYSLRKGLSVRVR